MQEYQHAKERNFIDFLVKNYNAVDTSNDFGTGVDVVLNGKPYDLKVSNSRKLTLFKYYENEWYCPLLLHPEVNYMYIIEQKDKYLGFVFSKKDVLNYWYKHPETEISTYKGDGNLNINITLNLSDLSNKVEIFRKE